MNSDGAQLSDATPRSPEAGFGLPELLVSLVIVLVIFGVMTTGLAQMSTSQRTIWNRIDGSSVGFPATRATVNFSLPHPGQATSSVSPATTAIPLLDPSMRWQSYNARPHSK